MNNADTIHCTTWVRALFYILSKENGGATLLVSNTENFQYTAEVNIFLKERQNFTANFIRREQENENESAVLE